MDNIPSFTVNPRIQIVARDRIEISFNGEEVLDNKGHLKRSTPEVKSLELEFAEFETLLNAIKREVGSIGISEGVLYDSEDTKTVFAKIMLVPTLKHLYSLPQPIWESYTTQEHSLGVAKTLTILAPDPKKAWLWEIAGLLHDIGKSVAAFFEGDAKKGRKKQGYYNHALAEIFLQTSGFNRASVAYMLALIDNSHIPYQYVVGDLSKNEIKENLGQLVLRLSEQGYKTSIPELLEDLKSFWIADGSDYSVVQCFLKGLPLKPSFCDQFVFIFSIKEDGWSLSDVRLKSAWQQRYDHLLKTLNKSN